MRNNEEKTDVENDQLSHGKTKIDVWFEFGVTMEVDDVNDIDEITRTGRPLLVDLITTSSIGENVTDIIEEE